MSTEKSISKRLAENLRTLKKKVLVPDNDIPYNECMFFNPNTLADEYADIFEMYNDDRWKEAFKIVTEGQGGELVKINSLISSSLLSLLVFYKLFKCNGGDIALEIQLPDHNEKIKFDGCLFEVRNEVIKSPSCIDVVLYSSTSGVLLFLESKFTEYTKVKTSEEYGKGYITLYKEYLQEALKGVIEVGEEKGKLKLTANHQKKFYIEGIKQSISHLIGIL